MPTAGYPSGTNTYVPNHEATGGLLVGFSRNQKDFAVNDYIQIFPVKNNVGLYASYTSRQAARILTSDDAEHLWADGEAAPMGFGMMDSFVFLGYSTSRRCYPFTIGDMAADQADWNIVSVESEGRAQQAMTARTMLVQAALSGASWGSNTSAVSNGILANGVYWDTGFTPTQAAPFQGAPFYKSLQYGSKQVNMMTLGQVKPRNLSLVVNPNGAQRVGSSNEMLDFIKQSPVALPDLKDAAEWRNKLWDIPDNYRGWKIVVEDAVRVSSKKGASSDTLNWVMPDNVAYLIAFPGKLEGLAGTRSYSTVQTFFYKDEMTVETMYDQPNRRTTARVVSNYQPVVATTLSGFKYTAFLDPAKSA